MMNPRKTLSLISTFNSAMVDLPTPININYWWNVGSLLGIFMMIQIITGILLSTHYNVGPEMSFYSVIHIMRDVKLGWVTRYLHMNISSVLFICLYLHTSRGLYFNSYSNKPLWTSGMLMMVLMMATAFLGYVLPWGQMSYWGATVITSLVSALPILGETLLTWLWGGFSVGEPTLKRFFSLHFLLPFLISFMILIHLTFLHDKGSSNPLGVNSNLEKMPFLPFFIFKDLLTIILLSFVVFLVVSIQPLVLSDVENFIPANPLSTPPHIQPEWYFLFAYTILRAVPNKMGGVIGLLSSILVLMLLPLYPMPKWVASSFMYEKKKILIAMGCNVITLTWLGSMPVESPFIMLSQISATLYFSLIILFSMPNKILL